MNGWQLRCAQGIEITHGMDSETRELVEHPAGQKPIRLQVGFQGLVQRYG